MQASERGSRLIIVAGLFYLVFGAAALIWSLFSGEISPLKVNLQRNRPALELLVLAAALGLNIIFDLEAPRLLPAAQRLFSSLGQAVGRIGLGEILFLSAASALGEELLFRGAVQPSLGLPAAALLFAISHFPARRELLLWPLYALIMGLVLGYLRILGGDVWSAVLLHFLVNLFGLFHISRRYARPR